MKNLPEKKKATGVVLISLDFGRTSKAEIADGAGDRSPFLN